MLRVLLIVIVFLIAGFAIYAFLKRRSKQEAESDIEVDDKTFRRRVEKKEAKEI